MQFIRRIDAFIVLLFVIFFLNYLSLNSHENHKDLTSEGKKIYSTVTIDYYSHSNRINKKEIEKLYKIQKKLLKKISKFLGKKYSGSKIEYHLYPSFEAKGLITGKTFLSNLIYKSNSVHTVMNNWINGNDNSDLAQILLNNSIGKPKFKFLERGIAIKFSDNWRGEGYKYWASKFSLASAVPPLAELLDNQKIKFESRFITESLGGAFTDYLINKYGSKKFIENYKVWNPNTDEINSLEHGWHLYLKQLSKKYKNKIKNDRKSFPVKLPKFLKGFCFAHVGYNIYNGYLSKKATDALSRLKSISVNTISITPFTSMRDIEKPQPLEFWQSARTENDESVIHVNHFAKQFGMVTLLKPHIWVHHSWPGEIEMQSPKDWNLFFENYYKWIRHFAILAEMYKIPILSIGNELSITTKNFPAKWTEMIHKIRKIYSGKITYGANWGDEFENLEFWNKFDFIGLSEYYPISRKSNPKENELYNDAKKVFANIKKVHDKFKKPIIFTEIGFRMSGAPWKTFYEGKEKFDFVPQNQAKVFNAVLRAINNEKWIKGIYIWKWPSYLGYALKEHSEIYTPVYRPAEKVIKKWFEKL